MSLTTEAPLVALANTTVALANNTVALAKNTTAAVGVSREELISCIIMGFISIFGTLGNGLVIYVFTRKSDKVTSTIFILALAWTDLFTCMVIVPYTVVSIQTQNNLVYDFACKAYYFLITFNVPLSAFIMVAIAVDRYFSICHPFLHAVTPRRARISIMCLCFFAFTLGTITALMYSVYFEDAILETVARGEASWCPNVTINNSSEMLSVTHQQLASTSRPPSMMPTYSVSQSVQIVVNQNSFNTTPAHAAVEDSCFRNVSKYVYTGQCNMNHKYFSFDTINVFANVQASLYAISLLIVFTLYFLIYRSVVRRRAWRRKQKSWSHSPMTAMPAEKQINNTSSTKSTNLQTESQQENMELVSKSQNDNDAEKNESADSGHGSSSGNATNNTSKNGNSFKQQVAVGNGSSQPTSKVLTSAEKKTNRERRDFNFLANIRTAAMLFVVAIVFIFSFLPAWLMAPGIIPFNVIVFYMYFIYNSANPVIYAFMNQSFRKELKRVFQRDFPFSKMCCKPKPRLHRDLEESKTIHTIYSVESPVDSPNCDESPVVVDDVGGTEESIDEDDSSSLVEAAIAASSQANV